MTTNISIDDIQFEQSAPTLDYVDFVSHLGPDFLSARTPYAAPSADTVKMTDIACAAAYDAWQHARRRHAHLSAFADTLKAYLIKRAERALMRGQTVSAEVNALADCLCDRVDDRVRVAGYVVANRRSDYLMAVMSAKKVMSV